MSDGRGKSLRIALLALSVFAVAVGGVNLARYLPYDFYPYFWDGGNLLSDVMQEGFATEGSGTGYALRKYAYSLPLHYLIR